MTLKGYEDLDKINSQQTKLPNDNISSNANINNLVPPINPPFRRLLSMSDSNIHANSDSRSGLSLNTHVSLGSICFLPHSHNYFNTNDNARLMEASPVQIFKTYRKERTLLLTFILFYICFLTIGAICFQIIETPVELQERNEITILRNNFLMKYPEVKGKMFFIYISFKKYIYNIFKKLFC